MTRRQRKFAARVELQVLNDECGLEVIRDCGPDRFIGALGDRLVASDRTACFPIGANIRYITRVIDALKSERTRRLAGHAWTISKLSAVLLAQAAPLRIGGKPC